MNRDEIIARAFEVFADVPRPEHFTHHEHCCECREHDEVLRANSPDTISRESLGHMGWDPITFTTAEGFRYYLPGLIRMVLVESGDNSYCEQFFWHMGVAPEYENRYAGLSAGQCEVISLTLSYLLNHRSEEIERECLADDLLTALEACRLHCGRVENPP